MLLSFAQHCAPILIKIVQSKDWLLDTWPTEAIFFQILFEISYNSKSMENFEAFHWNILSSINLLFLKSGTLVPFFKALGHIMNIQREGRRNLLYKTWNNPHYFNTP